MDKMYGIFEKWNNSEDEGIGKKADEFAITIAKDIEISNAESFEAQVSRAYGFYEGYMVKEEETCEWVMQDSNDVPGKKIVIALCCRYMIPGYKNHGKWGKMSYCPYCGKRINIKEKKNEEN